MENKDNIYKLYKKKKKKEYLQKVTYIQKEKNANHINNAENKIDAAWREIRTAMRVNNNV